MKDFVGSFTLELVFISYVLVGSVIWNVTAYRRIYANIFLRGCPLRDVFSSASTIGCYIF
jgi:hypothetical protein